MQRVYRIFINGYRVKDSSDIYLPETEKPLFDLIKESNAYEMGDIKIPEDFDGYDIYEENGLYELLWTREFQEAIKFPVVILDETEVYSY